MLLSKWNSKAGKVKGTANDIKELNKYMNSIRYKIQKIYEKLSNDEILITAEGLKNTYLGKNVKQKMLLDIFQNHNMKVEKTNEKIFPIVLTAKEMKDLKIDHPTRTGDIFICAKPGWSLSSKMNFEIPMIISNSFNSDAYAHLDKKVQRFLSSGFMNETGLGVHGNPGNNRMINAIFLCNWSQYTKR